MSGVDPGMLQTALLQVAEATKAASDAAKQLAQAQKTPGASASASSSLGIGWSKLINKPPLFEFASVEQEIKAFRDWSWQLCQFLSTIDPNYDEELKKLFDDPSKGFEMSTASSETRLRSSKLYGL